MKHAVIIFALLAATAWGQMAGSIVTGIWCSTNIPATNFPPGVSYGPLFTGSNSVGEHIPAHIVRQTVTNTFHPTKWVPSHENYWNFPSWTNGLVPNLYVQNGNNVPDPDIRITEVREIVTAKLEWKGKLFTVELENNLLRKWEENWVEEPPVVPAGRWVPGPVQTNFSDVSVTGTVFSYSFPTQGHFRMTPDGKLEPVIVNDLEAK